MSTTTIKIKAPAMPEPGLYVDPAGDCFPSFTGDAYTAAQLAARDAEWLEKVGPVVNAAQKLLQIAERANQIMLQEAGIGVCDLNAIAETRAALSAITKD